jgi:hypothetical protein
MDILTLKTNDHDENVAGKIQEKIGTAAKVFEK